MATFVEFENAINEQFRLLRPTSKVFSEIAQIRQIPGEDTIQYINRLDGLFQEYQQSIKFMEKFEDEAHMVPLMNHINKQLIFNGVNGLLQPMRTIAKSREFAAFEDFTKWAYKQSFDQQEEVELKKVSFNKELLEQTILNAFKKLNLIPFQETKKEKHLFFDPPRNFVRFAQTTDAPTKYFPQKPYDPNFANRQGNYNYQNPCRDSNREQFPNRYRNNYENFGQRQQNFQQHFAYNNYQPNREQYAQYKQPNYPRNFNENNYKPQDNDDRERTRFEDYPPNGAQYNFQSDNSKN